MRFKFILIVILGGIFFNADAQQADQYALRQIFDEALKNGKSYSWLRYMTSEIDQRLSGSPGAAEAVKWTIDNGLLSAMNTFNPESVRGEQN